MESNDPAAVFPRFWHSLLRMPLRNHVEYLVRASMYFYCLLSAVLSSSLSHFFFMCAESSAQTVQVLARMDGSTSKLHQSRSHRIATETLGTGWSKEETEQLWSAVASFKCKSIDWDGITAFHFPNRTTEGVRSKFYRDRHKSKHRNLYRRTWGAAS